MLSKVTLCTLLLTLALPAACKKKEKDDTLTTSLLLLMAANQKEPRADIYPVLGFPGTVNDIGGSFPGVAAEYAVTIAGTSVTGVTLPDPATLRFTMPTVSGISENSTVAIVIKRNSADVLNKTIRYRPALDLALNQPNSFNRPLYDDDPSSFFKITVGSSGNHVFNAFGYNNTNLDLSYLSSPVSAETSLATSARTDAEYARANLAAGTYYIHVKWISGGFAMFTYKMHYSMHIANGAITPTSTSNLITSEVLCYDGISGSTANAAAGCAAINPIAGYNLTGRCTYPTTGGLMTRYYYVRTSDGYGFSAGYASNTCLFPGGGSQNEEFAIFQ